MHHHAISSCSMIFKSSHYIIILYDMLYYHVIPSRSYDILYHLIICYDILYYHVIPSRLYYMLYHYFLRYVILSCYAITFYI